MNIKNVLVRFFIAAVMLVGASCEKPFAEDGEETEDVVVDNKNDKDNNGDKAKTVTVRFNVLGVESASAGSTALRDVCKRLSFSVFDADGERCNYRTITQLSTDKDFGKVALAVPKGTYSFVFVAENGNDAPTISKPNTVKFKKNKLTDTYCFYGQYDVNGNCTYDITLRRVVAKLRVAINDATPQEIDSLQFFYTGGSSTLDPSTGGGNVNSRQTEVCSVEPAAYKGKSVYELYTFPHADGKPCQICRAQRRRLADNRSSHRLSEDICLELHQKAVAARSAVDPELRKRHTGVLFHRVDQIIGLVRNRLLRGSDDVLRFCTACKPDECASCIHVPVRRAESGEGRHEIYTARVRHLGCKILRVARFSDKAQLVAQPLDDRAADKD